MVTRQELEGNWNEVKGRLQKRWGQLTDDELVRAKGSANELVGIIQKKTGESRHAIEQFLKESVGNSADTLHQAAEATREYIDRGTEAVREGYDQVADHLRTGQTHVTEMVQRKPMESVAIAFGAGVVAGVVLGLILRD